MADSGLLTRPSLAGAAEAETAAPDRPSVRLRAEGVELLGPYQDSGYQTPKFLVRRSDGQVMQLPQLLYGVLSSLDGRNAAEIAAALSLEFEQELSPEDVSFLVEERLEPVGLIAPLAAPAGEAGPETHAEPAKGLVKSDPLLALRYRVGIVPAGVIWRVAGVFRPLFARPIWISLLLAFLLVDVSIVLGRPLVAELAAGGTAVIQQPVLVLVLMGLTVVSAAFHEVGHVTACRYGGARPGNVGIGLYLIWPAFYSTVTDAYRLDRVGRLRTDLGGVYFNALFMTGMGAGYLWTGQSWLLIALIMLHVETVWQFLPSIRLDGYYILADLVGVPDLFSFVGPVLSRLIPGRPTHARVRELRPWARRLIVLWVACVVPTLLYAVAMLFVAVPVIVPPLWATVLDRVRAVGAAARAGDVLTTTLGVLQLFLLALPWLGVGLLLGTMARMLAKLVARRWRGARPSPRVWAAVRRGAALIVCAGAGAVLVVRVARVATTLPAGAAERQLVDGALGSLHGGGHVVAGPGDLLVHGFLARVQLVGYARLAGSFDRHADVLAAARELSVVATGVLVACLLFLVLTRSIPPLAAVLTLAAAAVSGPALALLAPVGPAVLGCAWVALGLLLVRNAPGWPTLIAGGLAVAAGLATEPLLGVPLAAAAVVATVQAQLAGRRRTAAASADQTHGGSTARVPRHRAAARAASPALATAGRWLTVMLLAAVGGWGVLVARRSGELVMSGAPRTVVLLLLAILAAGGLVVPRLRAAAMATASTGALAAIPWPGADAALLPALVAALLLAALLVEAAIRPPVPDRAHPLLRALVAGPAVLIIAVGALFVPARGDTLAHTALAAWLRGPAADGGTAAVPGALWGDLVRDGVPARRLERAGSAAAQGADWTVGIGAPPAGTAAPAATFGTGPATLTVRRSEHAVAQAGSAAALQAGAQSRAAATALAERRAFGKLLVQSARFSAPADVATAFAQGTVDPRVIAVLAGLTAEHRVGLGGFPGTPGPGLVTTVLVTDLDGAPAARTQVAGALADLLEGQAAGLAPDAVIRGGQGVTVSWSSNPEPTGGS